MDSSARLWPGAGRSGRAPGRPGARECSSVNLEEGTAHRWCRVVGLLGDHHVGDSVACPEGKLYIQAARPASRCTPRRACSTSTGLCRISLWMVADAVPAGSGGCGTQPPQGGGKGTQPPYRPPSAVTSDACEALSSRDSRQSPDGPRVRHERGMQASPIGTTSIVVLVSSC